MKEINNTKEQTKKKAELWLSYGRVSSIQQVRDGNGLPCQKKRCTEYAKNRGHEIEQFFCDEGVSGGVRERPGLKALIEYINQNRSRKITLVCEDMNRLARDMLVYLSLKLEFERKGVKVLYVNQEIDDSPQGRIVEQMFMMIAQFFREENKQRVIHRQKSRLEDGYWCFGIPKGYKWSSNKRGGKKLLLDEPSCHIVKEALEKFANYELNTITDVGEFLYKRGINVGGYKSATTKKFKYNNLSAVTGMLQNILYTGYVDLPEWGINKIKGKHKALISLETHKKILNRVREIGIKKGYIEKQMDISMNRIDRTDDFPLRGALYCKASNSMITGGWVRGGQGNKFPYYMYPKKSPMKNKTINRDRLHHEFEDLLERLEPDERVIEVFKLNLQKQIEERENNKDLIVTSFKDNLKSLENKIQRFVERIGKTEDEDLTSHYESELKKFYAEKEEILEKIEEEKNRVGTADRIDFEQIRNALKMRRDGDIDTKKRLLANIFPEGLPVTLKKHLGTPKLSLPYHILEVGKRDECKMVGMARLELATSTLSV